MKILLVDDEKQLLNALSEILKKNKYLVDTACDGEQGLDLALTYDYDVIVLDVLMPKMNGFEVVKNIRQNKVSTPILMLSAKSEVSDKIEGLNYGADDYLSKPFDVQELLARIKALSRRKSEFTGDVLTFCDIKFDRNSCEISKDGRKIKLGKKEFQILEILMLNSGKPVKKESMIEKVWGYDTEAEYNTIEVYLSFIRKKIEAIGSKVEIKSIRGVGYTLEKKDV